MFSFGVKSQNKLDTCDERLKRGLAYALAFGLMDFTILYGHRDPFKQFELFQQGRAEVAGAWIVDDKSKIVTTKDGFKKLSKHNFKPSLAVDIAPYIGGRVIIGKNETETRQILVLAGIVQTAFRILDIPFIWGGNWDGDGEPLSDQTFQDLLHFQVPRIGEN